MDGISGQGQWEISVLSALTSVLGKAGCALVQGFRGISPELVVSLLGLVTKLCLTTPGVGHCPLSSQKQSGSLKFRLLAFFTFFMAPVCYLHPGRAIPLSSPLGKCFTGTPRGVLHNTQGISQ